MALERLMTGSMLNPLLRTRLANELSKACPTLHVRDGSPSIKIAGVFPVMGTHGEVIDRFHVRIEIPQGYPRELPIVRETGGRIPWIEDRHVNSDGTACVMMPEERYRVWPHGSTLTDFLNGPLRNFFLGQLARERGEPWPFGEWSHGEAGFLEFVHSELGTTDRVHVMRYLAALSKSQPNFRLPCPCQSGKAIRDCCRSELIRLRRIIDPDRAKQVLYWLFTSTTAVELRNAVGSTHPLNGWKAKIDLLNSTTSMQIRDEIDRSNFVYAT